MLRWILTFVIAFFSLLADAHGQEYLYKHYTVEDGLPSNTIYTVYRDSKGFLWATTDKGVARFNGIKFEKFTSLNGLADNEVFGCREDREGRLWFLCYNGELCYYKNDTFHNPQNTPFLRRSTKQPHTKFVSIQNDGSLAFTFALGSYACFVEGNKNYVIDISSRGGGIYTTFRVEKIGPSRFKFLRDLYSYIADTGARGMVKMIPGPPQWKYIDQIGCQDQEYLYGETGIYDIWERIIYPLPTGFETEHRVHQAYRNEKYWFIATANGLYIDDAQGPREVTGVLRGKDVSCITQGKNREYLVSTLHDGLYLFPESFASTSVSDNAYTGQLDYAREVKGHLFFCADKYGIYLFENGVSRRLLDIERPRVKHSNSICYVDTNLSLYYLSTAKSMKVENLVDSRITLHQYPCAFHSMYVFKKVIKLKDKLYARSSINIQEIELGGLRDGDSLHFRSLEAYGVDRPFCIAKSKEDEVWFTTIDKVFKMENGTPAVQSQFGGVSFKQFEFFGDYIVGYTQYNQLFVCKYKERQLHFDTVFQDCVWANLYKLDEDHVLISTSGPYFVLTLDPNGREKPQPLAVENRYLPLQVDQLCVGKDNCYFFKSGSIITVPKSELLKRSAAPVVAFTTIKSTKRSYRIQNVVELPYIGSGNIAISFSTLSLDGKDVVYQYSISNDERNKWVNFRGDINLANQAFGEYTVKVRGKTLSSEWSEPVAFTLIINRPFWAEWWFVGLSVCVTALLIYLVVRRRIQQTLKNREKEHENKVKFIKSEYKAMNALMNPHFIFNTLNNVQSLVNNDDKLNAIEYLAIFADLIRQNMHNISNEVIPLQRELELVENYLLLEKLRFEDQLSYTINLSDGVYTTDIMVPPLLIQPLVENSIKHGILPLKSRGIKGVLLVNIYEQNDVLYIEVRDNGIGIAKAKERKPLHQSFGLDNLKLRLEQLSIIQDKEISFSLSEILDENGVRWTVATIAMPLDPPEPVSKMPLKMAKA